MEGKELAGGGVKKVNVKEASGTDEKKADSVEEVEEFTHEQRMECAAAYWFRMRLNVYSLIFSVLVIFLVGWFQLFGDSSTNFCYFFSIFNVGGSISSFFENWEMALLREKEEEEYFRNRRNGK